MSMHASFRAFIVGLKYRKSDRDDEPAIYTGTGVPTSASPTGQTLASGQPGIHIRADAPSVDDLIQVTVDGGTNFSPVKVGTDADRYELEWVAGQRGKPGLNVEIQTTAESTRMVADPHFEVLGTNMTTALCTFNAEGGITLTTAGADGDGAILLPHLDADQSAWTQVTWGTDQETRWECVIVTGANITNTIIYAGLKLTNTATTATDANQVFFRYEDDNNDGEWEAVSSIANVDDAHDTGVVVAVSTRYKLAIAIDASRIARFYINDVLKETSAALTDAIDLIPYIAVEADGASAAKSISVQRQKIGRTYGA